MSYLYDELSAGEHGRLAAHLAVCPDCEARVIEWRAARKDLDAWQLPEKRARIVRARRLSRATMRNIRQNLFFSFVFNAAGIPIAAGIFFPWFGLLMSPIVAGAAMALSSVAVIGNSLRLRSVEL